MSSPRCEVVERTDVWPYAKRCEEPAVARVRLFNTDNTTEDVDVCQCHAEEAGAEYPDNIQELVSYR